MKKGIFYWHVHHSVLVEELTEPIKNRIEYIKHHKPKHEIETRLRLMRPATGIKPAWAEYEKIRQQALAEYEKIQQPAWAEYRKIQQPALAEYEKIEQQALAEYMKIQQQAWAEYEKIEQPALAEYEKIRQQAWAEYRKIEQQALAEYRKIIEKLHKEQCGCKEWNGQEINFNLNIKGET